MKVKIYIIKIIFIVSFLSANCYADIPTVAPIKSRLYSALNLMSTTYKLNGNELSVFINQSTSLTKTLPFVLKMEPNFFKSSYTRTMLESSPVTISVIFSEESLRIIIPSLYAFNLRLDKIHVRVYLVHPDLYGNDTADIMYVFNMGRQLCKKINWYHFDMRNVSRAFPDYQESSWVLNAIMVENMKNL